MPLDYKLIRALRRGVKTLCAEERHLASQYVMSQMTSRGTFVNRGGKEDLYYTMFGWLVSHALHISVASDDRRRYLDAVHVDDLDSLHRSVYEQCVQLDELMNKGMVRAALCNWRRRGNLLEFFSNFAKHTVGRSLSGEAASLFTKTDRHIEREKTQFVLSLQDETGGFFANEGAAIPDLLSTAVALFTLRTKGVKCRYDARDFVEVHINDDGSFRSNLLDNDCDVEYMFYGLLALGSL